MTGDPLDAVARLLFIEEAGASVHYSDVSDNPEDGGAWFVEANDEIYHADTLSAAIDLARADEDALDPIVPDGALDYRGRP